MSIKKRVYAFMTFFFTCKSNLMKFRYPYYYSYECMYFSPSNCYIRFYYCFLQNEFNYSIIAFKKNIKSSIHFLLFRII